ncbi:MAG: hypothetical protein ABSG15_14815 [FCB group bacterium]
MNIIKISSLIIILLLVYNILRQNDLIVNFPLTEDGYYSMTIARNIALGNNITIDGKQLTNGFQPLFTFITVPAFWLTNGNHYNSIRIIWLICILINLGASYLAGTIIRDLFFTKDTTSGKHAFWITFSLYLSSLFLFSQHFNGLETGCSLLMVLLLWRVYQLKGMNHNKSALILGIISGFGVLARIDLVFLVITIAVFNFIYNKNLVPLRQRMIILLIYCSAAFIISSPWWFYNYFVFGSLMPSSGRAQFEFMLPAHRILEMYNTIIMELSPYSYTLDRFLNGISGLFIRTILIGLPAIIIIKLSKSHDVQQYLRNSGNKPALLFAIILFIFSLVLLVWYSLFSTATWFYMRYLVYFALITILFWGFILSYIYLKNKKILYINFIYILGYILVLSVWYFGWFNNGYFRDYVINLDGKVNYQVLHYQHNMNFYLEKNNIMWFCDWEEFITKYLGNNPEINGWHKIAIFNKFFLYHRNVLK